VGTIAAVGNNQIGVAGVVWDVSALASLASATLEAVMLGKQQGGRDCHAPSRLPTCHRLHAQCPAHPTPSASASNPRLAHLAATLHLQASVWMCKVDSAYGSVYLSSVLDCYTLCNSVSVHPSP